MNSPRYLYMMVSRTDTGIGRIIRVFTHYEYNHVSLSLDPEFRRWVSFARYTHDVPLAGGFVAETPERLFATGSQIPVNIYRIEISESRYKRLDALFALAGHRDCGLIYNTFSAFASYLNLRFSIPGAYTCLDFANAVLGESYSSIRELDTHYQPQLIYSGILQDLVTDSGDREDSYFIHRNFWGATKDTSLHFARLFGRMARRHREDPVHASLH